MNRTKFVLATGILFAAAFVFSCGEDGGGSENGTATAECGSSKLADTTKQFCYAQEIFNKCGGNTYNPLEEYCERGSVKPRCGGSVLESNEFCYNGRVYAKCGGTIEYNPLDSFCVGGIPRPYPKCGIDSTIYNQSFSFCVGDVIYDRCNDPNNPNPNGSFNPNTDFCYYYDNGREIFSHKCGNRTFDPLVYNCYNNIVYELCLTEPDIITYPNGIYNPVVEFCSGKVYPKCNGQIYDASMMFCDINVTPNLIEYLCDGKSYDTSTDICRGNTIVAKKQCGSYLYDDAKQFCPCNNFTPCSITNLIPTPIIPYDLCGDTEYDITKSFCYNNVLYPRCFDASGDTLYYNPSLEGCFEHNLYNLCNPITVPPGICVRRVGIDSIPVLRCKQTGANDTIHMPYPFPGMKCLDLDDPNYPPAYLPKDELDRGKIVGKMEDDITGNTFNTVQIGKQVWMAENYRDINGNQLFYWGEVTCPSGWHIPSSEDWDTLMLYAGGKEIAGNRFKARTGWGQIGNVNKNENGNDDYGFKAVPLSPKQFEADVISELSNLEASLALWWTSTSHQQSDLAYFWYVISSDTEAIRLAYRKNLFKFSVRCLMDAKE